MASQLDLDQGGTNREWASIYLGPSVGWVRAPVRNTLDIAAAGTYTLDLSTTYVQVRVAGAVTIILPSVKVSAIPAGAQPGLNVRAPVTIVDIGGNGAAHPITIQPVSGAETILGLAQIQITSNFGGFILYPNNALSNWTNQA